MDTENRFSPGWFVVIAVVVLAIAILFGLLVVPAWERFQKYGQSESLVGAVVSATQAVDQPPAPTDMPAAYSVTLDVAPSPTLAPALLATETVERKPTETPLAASPVPTQTPVPAAVSATPTPTLISIYAHYNLAFASDRGGSFQIYLMDAENPEDWVIVPMPNGYEQAYWPTFCGQRVAFDVEDKQYSLPRWVYLFDSVQDSVQELILPDESINKAISPSCSPWGSYLGVTVNRGGKWFLDILDFQLNQIVFDLPAGEYPLTSNITWSPIQADIFWMGTRSTGYTEINQTVNFVSGAETTFYAQGRYPALSPDGRYLAYFCGNLFHLCIYDLQSGEMVYQQVIHYARQVSGKQAPASVAWSLDGEWVYFVSSLTGNWDVYRMHPDGSDLVNLTADWISDELMPAVR